MSKSKVAAVIDIGSSAVRMQISQWDGRMVTPLDTLGKPTHTGKEVFSTGYISFDTVRSLSAILEGFCEKAREYGITTVYAIASTAMREASNQVYILDHILTRNRLDVHVLEDTEVSALVIGALKNGTDLPADRKLFVYGGTGTTDFELHSNGMLVLVHSLKTGLLKMSEMLKEAAEFSRHIDNMAEEYVNTYLIREKRIQDLYDADAIIFGAGDLEPLRKLLGIQTEGAVICIQRDKLLELYESCRPFSTSQICHQYGLPEQQGDILYAMLAALSALLRMTKAQKLVCTQVSLANAMLDLILTPGARRKYNANLRAGAITSAHSLAGRYRCDMEHCDQVAMIATILFEKLKKRFGFLKNQGILLNIACILHESGYYTSCYDIQEASFDLVKNAHIYGLRSRETLLVANIITPQSLPGVSRNTPRVSALNDEEVLFAAKMHAILRLSDNLDYSHRKKVKLLDVNLKDGSLIVDAAVDEDFTLEQWMFRESASLFQEIFGIVPRLRIKNSYQPEESGI